MSSAGCDYSTCARIRLKRRNRRYGPSGATRLAIQQTRPELSTSARVRSDQALYVDIALLTELRLFPGNLISSVTCDYSARTRIRLSAYVDIALLTEPHHSHGNAIISAACEYSARVWIRLSAVGAACL